MCSQHCAHMHSLWITWLPPACSLCQTNVSPPVHVLQAAHVTRLHKALTSPKQLQRLLSEDRSYRGLHVIQAVRSRDNVCHLSFPKRRLYLSGHNCQENSAQRSVALKRQTLAFIPMFSCRTSKSGEGASCGSSHCVSLLMAWKRFQCCS